MSCGKESFWNNMIYQYVLCWDVKKNAARFADYSLHIDDWYCDKYEYILSDAMIYTDSITYT